MNKRTDAIRSMFSMGEPLSTDNKTVPLPRVAAGSVRSLRDTFSTVERENEELRAKLAAGAEAVELDPNLIDPSPHADRFDDADVASFDALKTSIAEKGQLIPILVRRNPNDTSRYQCAFGHRRVRAIKGLGIKIKAYIREMSDEDLVVAQGIENSARENLSFIERAIFALRLEEAGFARTVIQSALSIDRAEASKLVAVARGIPIQIVRAVGAAPKVGRARWQALAAALAEPSSLQRALTASGEASCVELSSDERFAHLVRALQTINAIRSAREGAITSRQGRAIARFSLRDHSLKLTMAGERDDFAAYVIDKLPELFEAFAEMSIEKTHTEA